MDELITITEASEIHKITHNSISYQIKANNIKPVEDKKQELRGYVGRLYRITDVERAISCFDPSRGRLKQLGETVENIQLTKKKYPHSFICEVLRSNQNSMLNRKMVQLWSNKDWAEFELYKQNYQKK